MNEACPSTSSPRQTTRTAELVSTLTCPRCAHQTTLTMPTNACTYFYECTGCGECLRPLPGDCCVFCSYGSVKCPPVQEARDCCAPRRDR